jgi:hypothetical protein
MEKLEKSTLENNKLIAEFMGAKFVREGNYLFCDNLGLRTSPSMKELKYHKSWDWLMSVIKKIWNIAFEDDELTLAFEEEFQIDYTMDEFINNDIESIYQRVVDYIKWYNEQ